MERNAKILVVDDEAICRKVVANILDKAGFETDTARDGQEALDKLNKETSAFSAVILDRIMPEMDGLICLQEIQKNPDCAKIPIIMLTCINDNEEIMNAVIAGAFDYLIKPVDQAALVELVEKAIR